MARKRNTGKTRKKRGLMCPLWISEEDREFVQGPWWYEHESGYFYRFERHNGKLRPRTLHRAIGGRMEGHELGRGEVVDHWNNHRWDNQRSNLRVTTYAGNSGNRHAVTSNTGVLGVSYYARMANRKPYKVTVGRSGKYHHGGYFLTLAEAEQAAVALRQGLGIVRYADLSPTPQRSEE